MFVGSIDSGTSSSRFMIYDAKGCIVGSHQMEHKQFYPESGMVEHDPLEIWKCVQKTMVDALTTANLKAVDIAAIGITNQRETTVVWNKKTGQPYHNAIVWNDTRTTSICTRLAHNIGKDRFRGITGLPISTYFSATKLMYLLDIIPGLRQDAEHGEALFGTIDTYLLWQLTSGKVHVTDVTNASRTMMMNLKTLQWDSNLLKILNIPFQMLPKILPSCDSTGFGCISKDSIPLLEGVRITGVLGDQQAALFGQGCYQRGEAKCTYGTGGFLLLNTGTDIVHSQCGLITTVAFQLGVNQPPVYALEGAIAYCGSSIQWLRDNLEMITDVKESETIASTVLDNGGVYFVPAFAGLFCPHWREDARGALIGLSAFNTKAHVVRAALEATAFQTCERSKDRRKEHMSTVHGVHTSFA
eukprot:gene5330-10657_t